jgi:glutaredoxin
LLRRREYGAEKRCAVLYTRGRRRSLDPFRDAIAVAARTRRWNVGQPTAQSATGMNPLNTILYTRRGCHLCDDARELLERHGLAPREVDIDADPQLRARYDTCVPVVEIDGRERFRGRIEERLLRRLLAHRPAD